MKSACVLVLLLGLLVSCEKDITIELQSGGNKSVLYSFIYPDSALKVHFSKSVDILSTENFKYVEDGKFTLGVNDAFKGTFSFPENDVWASWSGIDFKEEDRITILATDVGSDTVRAATYIPALVSINQMDTISSYYKGQDGVLQKVLKCKVVFADPSQLGD